MVSSRRKMKRQPRTLFEQVFLHGRVRENVQQRMILTSNYAYISLYFVSLSGLLPFTKNICKQRGLLSLKSSSFASYSIYRVHILCLWYHIIRMLWRQLWCNNQDLTPGGKEKKKWSGCEISRNKNPVSMEMSLGLSYLRRQWFFINLNRWKLNTDEMLTIAISILLLLPQWKAP